MIPTLPCCSLCLHESWVPVENIQIHTHRRTSGDMTIDQLDVWNACVAPFMSQGRPIPVNWIWFSSQSTGRFPTLWSLDVDDRGGCGPPDRHMPGIAIIATCIVNTVVTFQVNKFQTHISLMVSLSSSLLSNKKKLLLRTENEARLRCKPDRPD